MSTDAVDTVIGIDVSFEWLDTDALPDGIASVVELSNELDVSLEVLEST